MSAVPESIGRYRPVGVLGTGAMGTVYRAQDPLIGRMVAIKVVRTEALDDETRAAFVERFRLEVQAAGRCAHPAIVGVHDFLEGDGHPCIVMELVEGRSLQEVLRSPGGAGTVPGILLQVLAGLGYAHGQGITHRDIKPANIIITQGGQAKIADFGIARLNETQMTAAGNMLGTPSYMAPEQVANDDVDHRADLFAVAAILYESLAGRPPFAGRSMADTIRRLSGPEAADLAPVAGSPYAAVLQKALAKDPAERFASADAFIAALQDAVRADPQATVVLAGGMSPMPAQAAPSPGPPTAARKWDPALLQRVERVLAQSMGPVARMMVVKAAAESADLEELYARLAQGVRSASDRSAFLRSLGGARVEPSLTMARSPSLTTMPPSVTTVPPMTVSAPVTIPAEAQKAAQTALAFHVGPIARVLVQKAAKEARSPRDFIDMLASHVTKPDEAATLRRRLRAEVEPKLS
ncbi:MAG: serine/threonine protein kinase [Proteobacteria bacterium]|nr:serine/threonine protein kinase [Pseudomonadota bacterium]